MLHVLMCCAWPYGCGWETKNMMAEYHEKDLNFQIFSFYLFIHYIYQMISFSMY